MPFVNLLVHFVWATKDRKPLLNTENKNAICEHIRQYAATKNIHLLNINGCRDHLHALVSLTSDQNIATIMNLLKGESSYWANRHLQFIDKFGWQDEYFAVSINVSHLQVINDYINQQEVHHQTKSFTEEYDEFISNYDFGENAIH